MISSTIPKTNELYFLITIIKILLIILLTYKLKIKSYKKND